MKNQYFDSRPLFVKVRDEIAARIVSREWVPRSMLPNEAQLAHDMSVSIGTIRKALEMLEEEKLVSRKQGRGTFVVDQNNVELATRFSSIQGPHGQKLEETSNIMNHDVVPATADDTQRLDAVQGENLIVIHRVHRYHNVSFLDDETRLVQRHWPGLDLSNGIYQGITALAQEYGVFLSHAAEQVRAELCPETQASRLSVPVGSPVLNLERTVFDKSGRKVEWRLAWFSGSGVQYALVTK